MRTTLLGLVFFLLKEALGFLPPDSLTTAKKEAFALILTGLALACLLWVVIHWFLEKLGRDSKMTGPIFLLILGLACIAGSFFWILKHNKATPKVAAAKPMTPIFDRDYYGQDVVLDGHEFIRCKFTHANLIWYGEPFSMRETKTEDGKHMNFSIRNEYITRAIDFFHTMGWLDKKVLGEHGPRMMPDPEETATPEK